MQKRNFKKYFKKGKGGALITREQTKLVAVLSTVALLAIDASMTFFAATGWAEEDGTWICHNRDGERAADQWKKSGNNWYWLDSNDGMTIDQLIEDDDSYYYVDINDVMAVNQWVTIDNKDVGEDNESDHYWYYFQVSGGALRNDDNDKVALETADGKEYVFDDEGKVLYNWVTADNAERLNDTDDDGFKKGGCYLGGEDDGAMTIGWLQMDITYDEATNDNEIAPVFSEDEDQSRWLYFESNGRKIKVEDGDAQKGKTTSGKKYEFGQYSAVTAEWSLDAESASKAGVRNQNSNVTTNSVPAKYAQQWRYFQDVENGAHVSKGWFKVVAARCLNYDKSSNDEDAWYYADGSGNLYAGKSRTIKDKKYASRNDGRIVDGLKFVLGSNGSLNVRADDDDGYPFDTEDDFIENAPYYENANYKCYYFGDGDDGSMKTSKINVDIDGDKFNFYFERSGSKEGAGKTGEKGDKYYQSGMLLKAGKDEKYRVVKTLGPTINKNDAGEGLKSYKKLGDVRTFLEELGMDTTSAYTTDPSKVGLSELNITKSTDNIDELYVIPEKDNNNQVVKGKYFIVNTFGKVIDSKSRNKDSNDYYYVTGSKGEILAIYIEK